MNISFLIFYIIPFCCSFQNKFYWKQAKANSRVEVTILGATKDNEALTIDTVKKTGYAHSDSSKAKISAANKGKVPWNQGRKHPEETRLRIAEKTRAAALAKKLRDAEALGLTIEEYDQQKKDAKKVSRTVNVTKTGGLTEDGRRRISESLKLRWKDEEYRKRYVTAAGRNVTAETREKISKAIKLKWQDVEYRAKCMSGNITLEQRQRISSTLKERWRTDEDFKTRMRNNLTHPKTEAWKAAVSQKIKDRWNDPEYRSKIVKSNRTRTYNESDLNAKQLTQKKKKLPSDSSQAKASIKASREKIARSVQSKTQQIATKLLREAQKSSKEDVYAAAKRECRLGMQMSSTRTVREMLGEEFWAEEKLQRAATAKGGIVDDMTLELTLISEWSRESVPPEVLANVLELSAVDDDNRSEKSIQDKLVDVDNATAKPQSSVSSKKSKAGSKRGTEEADDDSDAPVDGDDEDEDEGDYVIEYMGH